MKFNIYKLFFCLAHLGTGEYIQNYLQFKKTEFYEFPYTSLLQNFQKNCLINWLYEHQYKTSNLKCHIVKKCHFSYRTIPTYLQRTKISIFLLCCKKDVRLVLWNAGVLLAEGVIRAPSCPLVPFLRPRLPENVNISDASLDVLCLLRVLHALSRHWGTLYTLPHFKPLLPQQVRRCTSGLVFVVC